MPRGGARKGSGPDSTWKLGKTKAIRVPEALADQLLKLARNVDATESLELSNVQGLDKAISILGAALSLRPNAGGAIKTEIRKALDLLVKM